MCNGKIYMYMYMCIAPLVVVGNIVMTWATIIVIWEYDFRMLIIIGAHSVLFTWVELSHPGERVREILRVMCDLVVFHVISFDPAYMLIIALTWDYSRTLRKLRDIAVNRVHLVDTYVGI